MIGPTVVRVTVEAADYSGLLLATEAALRGFAGAAIPQDENIFDHFAIKEFRAAPKHSVIHSDSGRVQILSWEADVECTVAPVWTS